MQRIEQEYFEIEAIPDVEAVEGDAVDQRNVSDISMLLRVDVRAIALRQGMVDGKLKGVDSHLDVLGG